MSFEQKEHSAIYTGNSTRMWQRKNKTIRKAAVRSSKISEFFQPPITDDNEENESNNEKNESDNEKNIHKVIEFVTKVKCKEMLSKTQEIRYTAVLYFLQLLLKGQAKMETAKAVTEVVNGGLWLARSIRK